MAVAQHTVFNIVNYLKQCDNGEAKFSEIAQCTGIAKPFLCKHLRELAKKGTVLDNSPTKSTWSLVHDHAQQQIKHKILRFLSQRKGPQSALDIARGVGLQRKKQVNPVLYQLERAHKVIVSQGRSGNKPMWCLVDQGMEEDQLYRDTSGDSSAPGTYGSDRGINGSEPGACNSSNNSGSSVSASHVFSSDKGHKYSRQGSGQHGDKQHQRHQQRPTPYSTVSPAQRQRNLSGSELRASTGGPSAAEESVLLHSAGLVTVQKYFRAAWASSSAETEDDRQEDGMPTSTGDANQCPSNTAAQKYSNGDSTATGVGSDVDANLDMEEEEADEDSGFEPHSFTTRFQDMMDDLMFSHMTYVDDEEEEGAEAEGAATISPDVVVLLQLSMEQNHRATAEQLAQRLGRTEKDVRSLLAVCGDRVIQDGTLYSLTEAGQAWLREKQYTYPSPETNRKKEESRVDGSVGCIQHQSPSSVHNGPPLSPRRLIAAFPSLYQDFPSSCGIAGGPGRGAMVGESFSMRNMAVTLDAYHCNGLPESAVSSHMSSQAVHGLLPHTSALNSSPHTPPLSPLSHASAFALVPRKSACTLLPHASSFPPSSTVKQETVTEPGSSDQSGEMPQGIQESGQRMAVAAASSCSVADMMQPSAALLATPVSQSNAEGGKRFPSLPSLPSSSPLQKFMEEGLTLMPSVGPSVGQAGDPASGNPEVSLGPPAALTKQWLLNRTAETPGIAGLTHSRSSGQLWDSERGDLPHSFSQPQLNSEGSTAPSSLQITSESFAALNKNPISALMEYAQSRRMQAIIEVISQRGPSHRPVFVMAARVGSRQFVEVTCSNKKDGRKEAADVALRTLIAEGQYSAVVPTPSVQIAPEEMTHFDKVAALTHQTFNSLIATIPENLAGRKVIAGLVMKRSDEDVGVVISIGTGNRCITGDKLSLEGNTVNDSHAEIITRRGFMRFLYQQLEGYSDREPHPMFERGNNGKLRVKAGITFHLYISTAPCGDGALFSPRDAESNSSVLREAERRDHRPTFTSNVQGLLRTKMEGGEGTIPVDTQAMTTQTWDGVVRGERLRTISCTDKICRWNVLGLQGALLSHFLEPIYLDSLTLGFLYDHGHLSRAVCCRLARDEPQLDSLLPSSYQLNHPWLGRVTACQPLRETQKTKAYSINWTVGDERAEVLDGTLGHCYTAVEKTLISRLTKRSLYDSFKRVAHHLGRSDLLEPGMTYRQSKMMSRDFQAAKAGMLSKFQQLGCGWVRKPVEEEMFS